MNHDLKTLIAVASVGLVAVSTQANTIFFETYNVMPDDPTDTASQVGGQTGDTGLSDFFEWTGSSTTSPYITVTVTGTGMANVSWNLTGTGDELEAIYAKGGSNGGNIFTISDTASDFEELIGSGSINTPTTGNSGMDAAFSHIDFLVGPAGTTRSTVPDGGTTVMMLGIALWGLGLMRRKLR